MIRKATLDDLDCIYKIALASFETPWARASLEAEFYNEHANIYVYECENEVRAYIITWLIADEAELLTIAVDEGWRNKGIGKSLINYMKELYGNKVIWHLEVACSNKSAIHLYKSYGFEINSIITSYYGTGKDAYRMLLYPNLSIKTGETNVGR